MLLAMGSAATLTNVENEGAVRPVSPDEFAAARRVFESGGYTYANLCSRLGVERLYEYKMPPAAELLAQPVEDALGAVTRLFFDGLYLHRSAVERFLSAEGRETLYALDLLQAWADDPEMDFAPAVVFPFLDALVMSDRFCGPSGEEIEMAPDAVFPALFDNTYNFVTRLPETACEAVLDLGTGAGAAAIFQSRIAGHVWATDITARAARFAEFNRRLNGCDNVETAEGDLYEPVRGLTFDRIVTQPPYIPVAADKIAYRDGGKDGEQIFRRVVEGLPEFLRPGGTCYALLMATDREGETFEQRIRKWLGDRAQEFDILLGCDVAQEPMEFLRTAQKIPKAEKEYRRYLYQETKTCAILYCSVIIRRKRNPGPAVATRVFVGKTVRGEDLDFQLAWNAAVAAPGGRDMLLNARPRLGAHCELAVVHRVRECRLVADEFELHTNGPFVSKGKIPAWVARMVAECDGALTWGERLTSLQAEGRIPPEVNREEFSRMLSILVSTGVFEVSRQCLAFHGGEW